MRRADRAAEKGQFSEALTRYRQVASRNPGTSAGLQALRHGARVALLDAKEPRVAAQFLQDFIMSSPDEAERRVAQEQLVAVYFEHLADYRAAIVEINRLISLPLPASKQRQYRLQLARSYFYLNNYVQARAELDTLGADLGGEEEPFEVTLLRANVAMAMKQTGKAEAIYKALLEKYPERSREENILTNLTLILEEEKRFEEAIAALEKFRTPSSGDVELLDLRIKRLRARLAKQPGAQGLKK